MQIVVQKSESASNLIAMIRPLLNCYKKIQSSPIVESLQEGPAFDQRLKTVLESKIFKKKIHLGKSPLNFSRLEHTASLISKHVEIYHVYAWFCIDAIIYCFPRSFNFV